MFGTDPEIVPPNVQRAYHACALGELRIDYPLTPLVAPALPHSVLLELREVHFSGGHSDIGGGLIQRDLADIALGWMASQLDRTIPGLVPAPSFDRRKPGSGFWLDLCEGHIDAYGQLPPHRYPVKLSDGFELVCSIVDRPRPRHLVKVMHASVPESIRRQQQQHESEAGAGAGAAVVIAPLEPAELLIRSRWALEDDSSRSHRTVAGNVRKLMRWAVTTDVKLAAAGRHSMAAIGHQIGHARQGFDTAIGHADAALSSARLSVDAQMVAARSAVSERFDLARHHLGRLTSPAGTPLPASPTSPSPSAELS